MAINYLTLDSSPIGPIDIAAHAIVDAAYSGRGPKYPIDVLNTIAQTVIEYCKLAHLRPSYVAGHMMEETGAFHFGGDVVPEQYNFGGIGTTGGGVKGLYFGDAVTGVKAMIAHECAYIYGALDNWPAEVRDLTIYDPRAIYVMQGANAGKVTRIGNLGSGVWAAANSVVYAPAVIQWANAILKFSAGQLDPVDNGSSNMTVNVVNIMSKLATNSNGGPNYQMPDKVGIIFHYNGPPPNNDAYIQYINDSSYHVNKDWSSNGSGSYGDGIMYHYGIQSGDGGTYPDGTIFRLRDEADVLWHCGAWLPGGNESGIAINLNIGEGQHISAKCLESAKALANDIRARYNITSLSMVKGHQEVSPTACPGTIMGDLIYPYRAGDTGSGTVQPVVTDQYMHENGFTVGGGFKSIVDRLERISHTFRMQFLGYAISDEGDGYLCSPETNGDGSSTGRFHVKNIVLQKFERGTLIHEADEPNTEWQDVVPLVNRGFLAGFADDPEIDAILTDPDVRLDTLTTTLPEKPLDAVADSGSN